MKTDAILGEERGRDYPKDREVSTYILEIF